MSAGGSFAYLAGITGFLVDFVFAVISLGLTIHSLISAALSFEPTPVGNRGTYEQIVEAGPVDAILSQPMHPYTHGLIASVPSRNRRGSRLAQIPGMAPRITELPRGCAFRPRCDRASARCAEDIPLTAPAPGRELRCVHPLA